MDAHSLTEAINSSFEIGGFSLGIPAASTPIFIASSASTRIDKISVCNSDASPHTLDMWLLAAGQAPSLANKVEGGKSIAANTTIELSEIQGQVLAKNASIQVQASSANVLSIIVSGTQLS